MWPAANATVDSSSSALFVNADGEKFYLLEGVMYNADACAAWAWICFLFFGLGLGIGFLVAGAKTKKNAQTRQEIPRK